MIDLEDLLGVHINVEPCREMTSSELAEVCRRHCVAQEGLRLFCDGKIPPDELLDRIEYAEPDMDDYCQGATENLEYFELIL